MNSKVLTSLVQGIIIILCLQLSISFGGAAENCQQPVGRLVSLQGEAQVQRNGAPGWQVVVMDAKFCPGDMLRVLENGRVAVVLSNENVLRIGQRSIISFGKPSVENSSILELLRGVLHIFSHRPRSLKVVTPYVNGVVEGTEFLVRVDTDSSVFTVFEGMVAAVNQQGELNLTSGQSAIATEGAAPKGMVVVRPRDAVEWTLYFPAIFESSATFSNDDIAEPIRQAAADLFIGRVDEGRVSIAKVLRSDPDNSEALALSSIIETVRNNKEQALELALRAVERSPKSASANLALSYAHQALFDIPAALKILQQASEFTPDNGLVKARFAELLLAVGELDKALVMALDAAALNPEIGLSQTILGFAYLSRIEIDEALAAFNKAIMLDSAMPLARLGLGLAKIRTGRLEEGRADIEISAALDPGNSLIRSYLGKAYFDEKRDSQARRQYEIAKELDPADPTPWFYDAIRKQTINRPVEALHDLQQSIARNDNRAVYRSRLLLDGDLASRSAGLGRIYTDLGFQQLAQVEGWKSIQSDPSNYSAHRLLADTYGSLPRHEIAKVSELLQSQLLQPLNVTPIQPQLAESNLAILEGAGPSATSFNEFNPLFLRDRITLQASGVAGSNDILGDEIVVSGVEGRFSYSFGQFHYETNGIRDNNDQNRDIYTAFFQAMLSPATSFMGEIRYKKIDFGDTTLRFDPDNFSSSIRQFDDTKSVRVGLRHNLNTQSKLIGTAIIGSFDGGSTTFPDDFFFDESVQDVDTDNHMVEVQHLYQTESFNLRSGTGYSSQDGLDALTYTFPDVFSDIRDLDIDHLNFYSYSQIEMPSYVVATLGLSFDSIDSIYKDDNELNPKFGITWQPSGSTLIRAAAFKSTTRFIPNAQTIEPTDVAGFNQFFDDLVDTTAWTYGAAIEQEIANDLYGGIRYFHRDLDVPYPDFFTGITLEDDWQEDTGLAYLYWAPLSWISLGFEYYYEKFDRDNFGGIKEIGELTTHRVTPSIKLFYPNGITAQLLTSYVDQEGKFGHPVFGLTEDGDQFWVVDLSLGYRLPKRYGFLRLEIKNLFDERFSFVDTDPANPRLLQEQQIIGSFTVSF